MAVSKQGSECSRCVELEARVAALEAQLAAAQKNSRNSSKPPSSDIVNPPPKANKRGPRKKRKRGGQPGHARHQRPRFEDHELDQIFEWRLRACPCCVGPLQDADQPPKCFQQMELEVSPVHVDETGHKDNGQRLWTWCFRAQLYTVFKISPSRGSDVLIEVLGKEFAGVLGCDYFSAYRKYMRLNENVGLQFCLAHLIRDVKFLAEHPNAKNRAYGQRLRELFRKLFHTIHRRDEYQSDDTFRLALERIRNDLCWEAGIEVVETKEAANMAERFYQHVDSYFRFITEPGIETTNNVAEQAIRFVAVHRRMTQGTRSAAGQRWFERICTVAVTCQQQGRSAFDFLYDSITAMFSAEDSLSLLPIPAD